MPYKVLTVLTLLILMSAPVHGEEFKEALTFSKNDNVLVLAAHPDDETIGCAGVIQKALGAGAKVKVVLLTNGDNNEFAFLVYKKRPILSSKGLLRMGEVRRTESIKALTFLGLTEKDIVFLGYPDFGTLEIFKRCWKDCKPYRSMLTKVKQVSYPEAKTPGASYTGESVLGDIESVLSDFKPTKIFVTHPADYNVDHEAFYLFLKVALWDVADKVTESAVFPYLVHASKWPHPRGYHKELGLEAPKQMERSVSTWTKEYLTAEELEKKHKAISFYRTEIEYSPRFLYTFASK
ncbi:MAG: PIG-L family deacetylase [Candidatus Omnitrophica bacterium]|nr:PIG-L family deacetylase [Candidatus Omnitrophota bacterium]